MILSIFLLVVIPFSLVLFLGIDHFSLIEIRWSADKLTQPNNVLTDFSCFDLNDIYLIALLDFFIYLSIAK